MKKLLSTILIVVMLVAVLTSCNSTGNSSDGKVYTLKMSTQLNEGSPFVQGFKAWAEAVKERTDGKLIIEVYPSGALGSDEDVIEQALEGVNVAVLTDCGRMANYVPDMGKIGRAHV